MLDGLYTLKRKISYGIRLIWRFAFISKWLLYAAIIYGVQLFAVVISFAVKFSASTLNSIVAGVCSVSSPLTVYISDSPGIFKLTIEAYECSRNAPIQLIPGYIPDNVS